jgi:sugar/nucleoside kinase (ribokinase family)
MTMVPDVEAWQPVLAGAKLIHFSIPNWARRVLPVAGAAGAVVSVDIQDVRDLDDPYRRDFVDAADVLFVSSAHLSDPRGALDALRRPGQIAVCTMGARGCAVRSDDGYREHAAAVLPAPIVDTNGAGDSLAAALLSAYVLDGRPLDEAVRRGQLAARWCCTTRGSQSLITRPQLDDLDATMSTGSAVKPPTRGLD